MWLRKNAGLISAGIIVVLFLLCSGFTLPLEAAVHLTVGWLAFLYAALTGYIWISAVLAIFAVIIVVSAAAVYARQAHRRRTADSDPAHETPDAPHSKWHRLPALALVAVLLLAAISLDQARRMTGRMLFGSENVIAGDEGHRRNNSSSKLKQFGIAVNNHQNSHGSLPAGCTVDGNGDPLHSWTTVLLPYVENVPLYRKVRFDERWDSEHNLELAREQLDEYLNNGVNDEWIGLPPTHYAGNHEVLGGATSLTFRDVKDGISKTLLIGEAYGNFKPWAQPGNWRDVRHGLRRSRDGFGGPWARRITQFSFADGSVREIDEDIDPKVLEALATPNGGEELEPGKS